MKIRFMYDGSIHDPKREKIIHLICDYLSTQLKLPNELQIKFSKLNESMYGAISLDYRFKNRITINGQLKYNEVPEVIIHELLHVDQVETGLLSVDRLGNYIWKKRIFSVTNMQHLTQEQYLQLPWEQDVANKQQKMLQLVTEYLGSIVSTN